MLIFLLVLTSSIALGSAYEYIEKIAKGNVSERWLGWPYKICEPNNCPYDNSSWPFKYESETSDECDMQLKGQILRKECNTCVCSANNKLLCTKKGCLTEEQQQKFLRMREKKKASRTSGARFQTLPHGKCKPGAIYTKMCNKCFCNGDRKAECTTKPCGAQGLAGVKQKPITEPQDIRPPFSPSEIKGLEPLSHFAAECIPGRSYRIECNACLCLRTGNLLCQKKFCLSYFDTHQRLSHKLTGVTCSPKHKMKAQAECVKCKCINNKQKCTPIPKCKPKTLLGKGISTVKETLDITKGQCEPDMVYTSQCNKCYCQDDGSLRCTQKLCVNHSTAKILTKQLRYLEAQGL